MTKLLEQALRQVEQLSESDQDAAAAAMIDYLSHRDDYRLSDAQLAEVRRRRADPNRKLVSHAEAKERLRNPLAASGADSGASRAMRRTFEGRVRRGL